MNNNDQDLLLDSNSESDNDLLLEDISTFDGVA